jgi:mRNA-degrading endonuclease RelE of RelBE toxin-antitoxin system
MQWNVNLSKKAVKQLKKLPENVKTSLIALIRDIQESGPVRGNWPNYSRLGPKRHHCHLKKGKTTYVAIWQVVDKEIHIVEVSYVGTHEKAPY